VFAARYGCLILLLACAAAPGLASEPLSPRNASYRIEVTLDPESKTLEGYEVIEWRNLQRASTQELRFHLYWNAWRNNRSTWMLGNRLVGHDNHRRLGRRPAPGDWSWVEVDSVQWLEKDAIEGPELERRFASPDDGNPDDRTVMVVSLPEAVGEGETARVSVRWRARIPRTFARTGYHGDFYFFGQWFPKLGVFESGGWNCHQFHVATEFYADYGVYDVSMTVPGGYVVGATGRSIGLADGPGGTETHRYYQEDVHDFAWTASPYFRTREERFEVEGLPPVDLRLLIQPEHLGQAGRYFDAARAALESYGRWYGPYPYGHVTLVDPAWRSGAGGMEYPTLISVGTRRFAPVAGDSPESVIIHEMGHQFWYGLVANDEVAYAWLDEGLVTFSTLRIMETVYDRPALVHRYFSDFVPVVFPEIRLSRWHRGLARFREHGTSDTPARPSYLHHPGTAHAISYEKPAAWLATLENHLGWETLREILSTFFARYRFGHPTPEDFFAVVDEVAEEELTWFFDQVHRDSVSFDYGISSARSSRVRPRGWAYAGEDGNPVALAADDGSGDDDDGDAADDGAIYRTEVVVRRHGEGRFPVDVRLVFEDDHEIRERWDGEDRWKLIAVERPSRLDYAEVDPDGVLVLDRDRSNNTRTRIPRGREPALKWGSKWMVWFQDHLSSFAFFM